MAAAGNADSLDRGRDLDLRFRGVIFRTLSQHCCDIQGQETLDGT